MQGARWSTDTPGGQAATLGVVLLAGAFAGLLAVAQTDQIGPLGNRLFSPITSIPPPAMLAVVVGVAGLLAAVRLSPWIATGLFFLWLPFEDLIRKFQANDLRVYLIKDLLLVLAVTATLPKLSGVWRRALGSTAFWTTVVVLVGALLSLPTALRDVRIPIGAFHLRFLFLPLLPIGYLIGRDRILLRRTLSLLCQLAILVSAVGIAQSIVGLDLLNPVTTDPNLKNLTITKLLGEVTVVRPPGTFVDAARFGTFTTVTILLGACLLQISASKRTMSLAYATMVIGLWATFVSGGRTPLIFGIILASVGFIQSAPRPARKRKLRLVLLFGAALFVALSSGALGNLGRSNAAYYVETLGTGANSEFVPRLQYYTNEFGKGVRAGGLLGRGFGDQAIGQQYYESSGRYVAENGFGSIVAEGGPLFLALWIAWTASWVRRSIIATRYRDAASGPLTPVIATFVVITMTVGFAIGIQFFENYVTNVFFWFLSGVAFAAIPSAAPHGGVEETLLVAKGSR